MIFDGFPFDVSVVASVIGSSCNCIPLTYHFIIPSGSSSSSGLMACHRPFGLVFSHLMARPQSLLAIPRSGSLSGMALMPARISCSCSACVLVLIVCHHIVWYLIAWNGDPSCGSLGGLMNRPLVPPFLMKALISSGGIRTYILAPHLLVVKPRAAASGICGKANANGLVRRAVSMVWLCLSFPEVALLCGCFHFFHICAASCIMLGAQCVISSTWISQVELG